MAVAILLLPSYSADSTSSTPPLSGIQLRVGLTKLGLRGALAVRPLSTATLTNPSSPGWHATLAAGQLVQMRWCKGGSIKCAGVSAPPAGPLKMSCAGGFAVGLRIYDGNLELTPLPNGRLLVVNQVPLEQYVRGVLQAEGPRTMRPEALKALAVAVRTYGVSSRARHLADGFDLCDTTHCQLYAGRPPSGSPAERAATETAGEVLAVNGEPVPAVYSADCGGATADNESAGMGDRPNPFLRGVRDAPPDGDRDFCAGGRMHSWEVSFAVSELAKLLMPSLQMRMSAVLSISFGDPDEWGRARTVTIVGLDRQPPTPGNGATQPPGGALGDTTVTRSMPAWAFRRLVGEDRLPSTFVTGVKVEGDRVRISGRGYGHGVGMCLAGANGMAGPPYLASYRAILEHYYQGVTIADAATLCGSTARGRDVGRLAARGGHARRLRAPRSGRGGHGRPGGDPAARNVVTPPNSSRARATRRG